MTVAIPKAFIYLTRHDRQLLLLAYPLHPEVGLQVPAGTIEPGEPPAAAAHRELIEETGLREFKILSFLGERSFDMGPFGKGEVHLRYFFHATLTGDAPDRWSHAETHAGPVRSRLSSSGGISASGGLIWPRGMARCSDACHGERDLIPIAASKLQAIVRRTSRTIGAAADH